MLRQEFLKEMIDSGYNLMDSREAPREESKDGNERVSTQRK